MKRAIVVAALFFAVSQPALGDDNAGIGRFQLMDGAPIVVIDTVTGELWFVRGDDRMGYAMHRVCYVGPDGSLTPMPWNERIKELCAPKR